MLIEQSADQVYRDLSFNQSSRAISNPSSAATATTRRGLLSAFGIAMLACAAAAPSMAQATSTEFVPFNRFIEQTKGTAAGDLMARPAGKARDAAAIEEMRQSILDRYEGIQVTHSFAAGGNYYDCVPVAEQPSLRTYGLKSIAAAPPSELLKGKVEQTSNVKEATLVDPEKPFDEFGNSVGCEAKTVPLLRTTLEALSRFATLDDFYHKAPGAVTESSKSEGFADPSVQAHKYSFTSQGVNNLGGNSNLNLWSPYVNTGAGEVFSLSQEWYVGGSGSGLQTEEVGWVNYPAMFGDERSHFFIYSTSGNYASGTGCWNNSCNDFVQVAESGLLGNYFAHYSTAGGAQYEISAEYYLYAGNWWIAYNGTWIGYYPGSKYHGGQNSRYAQAIEFGTESVGTTIWAPEGSGAWSNTGFTHAAYQRNLWYFNTSAVKYWDSLSQDITSPACYSITGPYYSTSSGWGIYFYEGGPGGTRC